MSSRLLALTLPVALAACGAASTTATAPRPLSPRSPISVEVLDARPERPFVVVDVVQSRSVRGFADVSSSLVNELRVKAAHIGCDGVIVHVARPAPTACAPRNQWANRQGDAWGSCIVYTEARR